jgi:hypothetical protein
MDFKALTEYEHKGYAFKRCHNPYHHSTSYDCIVVMRKPENVKCNELRTGVVDKNFAKFRCNGLITVAIYDLNLKKFILTLEHFVLIGYFLNVLNLNVTYTVGTLTEPDKYAEDISLICGSGIHYFLSLEAALNYKNGWVEYRDEDGNKYRYDSDGHKYVNRIIMPTPL